MKTFSRFIIIALGLSGLCLFSVAGCGTSDGPPRDGIDGAVGIAEEELEASAGHPKCSAGVPLSASSDPCVADICASTATCCDDTWDGFCISQVSNICGLSCLFGYTMSPQTVPGRCNAVVSGSTADGAQIVQAACSGATHQRFFVEQDLADTYRVRNKKSSKCITVHAAGAAVTQETCVAGSTSQNFELSYDGAGFYRLADLADGLCLGYELSIANSSLITVPCTPSSGLKKFRFDF